MKKVFILGIAAASLSFGQNTCRDTNNAPFCGLIDAKILAERIKIEKQRADTEQQLRNAQAAAIRAQTEAEKQKSATIPAQAQYSAVDALLSDVDFNRLPVAFRVKFVKLVEPSLARFPDADITAVLENIAVKVLAPIPGPGGGN